MDELQELLEGAQQAMEKACARLQTGFTKIRAGRAMPSMLDGIMVEHYGNMAPISQVASVSTPDARTLTIKPWEKSLIAAIEKALLASSLGLTPQNDGEVVRINFPPLTEERRKVLVKQVKSEAENGRVVVRNGRKDIKEALKQLQKTGTSEDEIKKAEEKLQNLTDKYVSKIDVLMAQKEAEMMEV